MFDMIGFSNLNPILSLQNASKDLHNYDVITKSDGVTRIHYTINSETNSEFLKSSIEKTS